MTRQFQIMVDAALNAHYSTHSVFEENNSLRLITYAVNLTEQFSCEFQQKAHFLAFEVSTPSEQDEESDAGSEIFENLAEVEERAELFNSIDLHEYPILDNIIYTDTGVDDPIQGIMDWTERLYLQSRGVELGTFGGNILSSAFKEQSKKWADITKAYISKIIVIIHRFVVTLLELVCTDERVRDEIWAEILDEVLTRYREAMDQAMFLVSLEREKRPYILNHYFNENLQIAGGSRKTEELRGKPRKEIKEQAFNNRYFTSDNLIVDLDAIERVTTSKSNAEHVKEEIHDILCSYYKVSRKRFVDNVYIQAVDHCLLTGPKSPLTVFDQEWAISLSPERL
jgi:hypothetical protein